MQKKTEDGARAADTYAIDDPAAFAENVLRAMEQSSAAMLQYLERPDTNQTPYSTSSEFTEASKTMTSLANMWMSDPGKLAASQNELLRGWADVWNGTVRKMMGENVPPTVSPDRSDNRFTDPDWSDNPYFDYWKQMYLLTSQWAEKMLDDTDGLDARTRAKAEFHLRLMASAFSPSNFPATNPEVMRETFASNAENLVQGSAQFIADMAQSDDLLKISQTDTTAFTVGENLALTPGKVIYQNEILQLIQYAPTTEAVHETPLLIVPPWINKFYILDLNPQKSLLKYAVDQGFTVFIVSWVNPDASLANKSFEDYMLEGVLAAADAVRRETGVAKINIGGYCVGGTLVSTTMAYLAARGEDLINSATLLCTQVDFTEAGDLLLFTEDDQLDNIAAIMEERGFLDGSRMANVFNMMRPRDLIWPYIVNNYMLGRKPFPFDLLFWNQDSTRMPKANHNFYLRAFYNENRLARGALTIGGTPLALADIKVPIFNLATRDDHIAPAQSVYIGSKMFGGDVEFIVSGSGHIAGVVNPPSKMKYQYWRAARATTDSLEEWIAMAREHPGSWWPHWIEWLGQHSGDQIKARIPGTRLGTIEDAPGSYVKVRS